jgi:hypothetical protein
LNDRGFLPTPEDFSAAAPGTAGAGGRDLRVVPPLTRWHRACLLSGSEVRVGATVKALDVVSFESIVRAEFLEEPAMRLTMPQVARLFSLELRQAHIIVATLMTRGSLTLDERGRVCLPEALDL